MTARPARPDPAAAALRAIAESTDPAQLRRFMENARRMGAEPVRAAAFERLVSILPGEAPDPVSRDFWRMIHAFEELLSEERGRTTRLSRTRQKVQRVGVAKTLEDFALTREATDGFRMLMDRGLPHLTGEAVILRHPDAFHETVVQAAAARLRAEGVDVDALSRA